ncbi:MAG: hypothetical protein L0I62_06690 [Gammaproteobacteria bacterium]|nr:hypothetical protein [Gammaproteobacteria bacterium]
MELEELKQAWAEMDLRQDGMEALLLADFHARGMDKLRRILGWSLAARVLELLAWIVFTAWAASFWVDHRSVTHWLIIGLLLHAYGIAGIWASATQLLFLSRIRLFDAPVLVLQRRLAQLLRFRVWCTLALGLPWWFLWLLVPAVGLYQVSGVDLFAASQAWVWACMAVGVAGTALSVWLARHLRGRAIRSAFWRRMVDDMSGCNLRRASRQLDDIARFERD